MIGAKSKTDTKRCRIYVCRSQAQRFASGREASGTSLQEMRRSHEALRDRFESEISEVLHSQQALRDRWEAEVSELRKRLQVSEQHRPRLVLLKLRP
jgi:hypothetical protein